MFPAPQIPFEENPHLWDMDNALGHVVDDVDDQSNQGPRERTDQPE